MQTTMFWRPAPYHAHPAPARRALGQAPAASAPIQTPSPSVMDSPLLSLGTDLIAASGSGYLAWGFSKQNNSTMFTIWIVLATAFTVKGLHDLSRLNA